MTLKFKISDYKKLIFKEFSFQILEKLLRIVCGFIIISKLSDFLGPEEYGSLLFIESNYILFLGISGFGLAPNIIKYLAQRKIRYKDYVFNALFISVLSSLVCFVSLNLWALSLNDFSYSKFFLPVSFLILFSPIYFIEYYYNSLNKIRVNVIAPSIVDTPLANRFLNNETKVQKSAEKHPLNRVGNKEDIAEMISFLLSDKSSWMTGQILNVDGGLSTIIKN